MTPYKEDYGALQRRWKRQDKIRDWIYAIAAAAIVAGMIAVAIWCSQ